MKKIELLSPAGNFEKMEMAFAYGADAVYLGGKTFSMRSNAENFSLVEIKEAVSYAHAIGKKVFVAVNIIARNKDIREVSEELEYLGGTGLDALIISDPGVMRLAQKYAPGVNIHVSTQANILNIETARLFADLGAKRLILARELSLTEITELRASIDPSIEIEVFVHGSMCVSYSGRCLISNYMTNRDANRGDCAQPCRWNYRLVEEKRPGEYFPVYEDERGTYFFNSKDLNLIRYIPELVEAGVDSIKIEGRMKSVFYAAMTTRSYRRALDEYYADSKNYIFDEKWAIDLEKTSHRDFTTGFFFDNHPIETQVYDTNSYIRTHSFVGKILEFNRGTGLAKIMQRNPLFEGEEIEVINTDGKDYKQLVSGMFDENGEEVISTPHAQMIYYMKMNEQTGENSILVKKKMEV
ncbi:MAG: U32 family peptidase [Clostridia bacterium]|nr:U32 family peptidase [Clostridia bacterium]MBN2882456.1 U32 family peptidase [Clostridia bacterium]